MSTLVSRISSDPRAARITAWSVLIVGMILCRGSYLDSVIYNIDEAEYAVAADALDHGWLSGVDLLGSTKTPGTPFLYNLLFHIFGRSLAVIHVAHLVIVLLTGCFVIELAFAMWGVTAILPAAVLFWMVSNSFSTPGEILAMNVEPPGTLFAVFALWLACKRPDPVIAIIISGFALGLAMLFRQSFLFFILPVALAVFSPKKWNAFGLLIAGMGLVWVPILLIYAARDGVGWAIDSWIRYPLTYSSDVGIIGFFDALWLNSAEFFAQAIAPVALALIGLLVWWQNRSSRRGNFLLLFAIASFLALASGSRFFGHYWIQVFPAVALFGAAGWLWLARRSRPTSIALTVLLIIGALLALRRYPLWREWDRWAVPEGMSPYTLTMQQSEQELGRYARDHTAPDETIVVWGYCPQIYYHAQRLPGIRDYICHYVTGFSPGSFAPAEGRAFRPNSHPRAEAMFVADLHERRPKYIIDIAPIKDYEFPFHAYPLRSYPLIADFVRANYEPDTTIHGAFVYRLISQQNAQPSAAPE